MECVSDGISQACLLQAKLFNRFDGDTNFKNCTSKDCTALVTELNEALKKIEKLPNSSSEADDTTESCDATTMEEKTEAEKKDEAPQDSAKNSRRRKHISNSPSASSTAAVMNVEKTQNLKENVKHHKNLQINPREQRKSPIHLLLPLLQSKHQFLMLCKNPVRSVY